MIGCEGTPSVRLGMFRLHRLQHTTEVRMSAGDVA